ncbi:MAG: homogentisate 1,2-dioxygenase [Crocinitomicaceae bacterium]|jgi:homogentisate 1,2-dioxygenase|nr:homogentisate 1,2-dioxygenase [Crocinitomicaceae bacterium]MDP4866368.1 homogentisate 1,2-dioxygenase [Crocinitomicaceae bacterium]MDP5010048.1 homogentisate 1,2-dioxygenase [Crocinitomicaceae bacterium]
MPFYHKLGIFPHKRHTVFRQPNGKLYHEQLFGTVGFDGMSVLMYHINPPTIVKEVKGQKDIAPEVALEKNMIARSLKGYEVPAVDDYLDSRVPVLVNSDCYIELASPKKSMTDYFYKNADADEVIFIHRGEGTLKTQLGNIDFSYGDYLVVPRGMIYQMHFKDEDNKLFIVQSFSPVYTPKRYRNWFGQLLEHSPYCERDIRPPHVLEPIEEIGDFLIRIKKQDILYDYIYGTHPFDIVGWDGYNYPYAFSIHDFEPITGRVHLPPPIHQTFETAGFVMCSFVPRLYDYHPDSIPAPYNHSNIDSDEVLYYVDGDFMSRNNIEKGQITVHPAGIPHGPHPGAYERSIGKTETLELAVMVDTFKPLKLTKAAMDMQDPEYVKSWMQH